jgi:transcriptional regulator with XRE-family HTH domain
MSDLTIGMQLKKLRKQTGLSVKELATRAGVSQSYIYAIESGTRGAQATKLPIIASALGVPVADLYNVWSY